jgi:hypothetical protein
MTEHNRIQLVWVLGHVEIDRNEIDDELARQGSSHPLIGLAFGISAKVARGVIRDWTSRKREKQWQSLHGQRQAKGFLKILWGTAQPEHKPANIDRAAQRTISFKRTTI